MSKLDFLLGRESFIGEMVEFLQLKRVEVQEQIKITDKGEKLTAKELSAMKINFAEAVRLTEKEHLNLIENFGRSETEQAIEKLNNYKLANPKKKYFSDYRAILLWVMKNLNFTGKAGIKSAETIRANKKAEQLYDKNVKPQQQYDF